MAAATLPVAQPQNFNSTRACFTLFRAHRAQSSRITPPQIITQRHFSPRTSLCEHELAKLIVFVQCGEERPQCRNCQKSKRACAGYDPAFQSQSSHTIQPAPTSSTSTSTQSHTQSVRSSYSNNNVDPISPSTSSQNNSGATSSPRDHQDYSYHRSSELPALPNINQGYKMEDHYASSHNNPRCEFAPAEADHMPVYVSY